MHEHTHAIAMLQRVRAAQRDLLPSRHGALPSWDVLLTVAGMAARGQRACISDIAEESGVAFSSAQRSVELLEGVGLVSRSPDPLNARRVFVTLTGAARSRVGSLLEATGLQQ